VTRDFAAAIVANGPRDPEKRRGTARPCAPEHGNWPATALRPSSPAPTRALSGIELPIPRSLSTSIAETLRTSALRLRKTTGLDLAPLLARLERAGEDHRIVL